MLSKNARTTKPLPNIPTSTPLLSTTDLPVRLSLTGRASDIERISRLMRASGCFIEELETSDRVIGFVSIVAGLQTLDDKNGPDAAKLVRRTLSVKLENEENL
jgi:hypothetical protein